MEIVLRKASNKQWFFNIMAKNGRVIATSELYSSRAKAKQTALSLQKNLALGGVRVLEDMSSIWAKPAKAAAATVAVLLLCVQAIAGETIFVRSTGEVESWKHESGRPRVQSVIKAKDNEILYDEMRREIEEVVRAEYERDYGLKITSTFEDSNWCYDDHPGTHIRTKRVC